MRLQHKLFGPVADCLRRPDRALGKQCSDAFTRKHHLNQLLEKLQTADLRKRNASGGIVKHTVF